MQSAPNTEPSDKSDGKRDLDRFRASERTLREAMDRGLLAEFPNPEREGCPKPAVLKAIANQQIPFKDAELWLEHMESCSPCNRDLSQFRASRRRTLLALAACFLIVASLAGWALVKQPHVLLGFKLPTYDHKFPEVATLDLRDRSVIRGPATDLEAPEQTLEISRHHSRLKIYMPRGNSDGIYEVSIATISGESIFDTNAEATRSSGVTSVEIRVDFSTTPPGLYMLRFRKKDLGWTSFPLQIQ